MTVACYFVAQVDEQSRVPCLVCYVAKIDTLETILHQVDSQIALPRLQKVLHEKSFELVVSQVKTGQVRALHVALEFFNFIVGKSKNCY